MNDEKYSVGYFARGAFVAGTTFLTSGIILAITGTLMAVASGTIPSGLLGYWFLLLFAGFAAIVPGVLFLLLSRQLRKM